MLWVYPGILFIHAQAPNTLYGEVRVRVFRAAQDSLHLQQIEKGLEEELTRKPRRQDKIDSLMHLQTRIYREAITYKTVYKPSRGFVLSDSLGPASDLATIRKICIYGKSQIPPIVLRCKNLEALELVNTSIKEIPPLDELIGLKFIGIYNLTTTKPLRLRRNSTVTSLAIRAQRAKGLPRSYKNFKALRILDLAENNISRFPNGARHNKMLHELNLQQNAITLKTRIKKHPYLETLSLHNNTITRVPSTIRNCRSLKKLNFNSNKISGVHRNIGKLKKLELLSFYNNSLSHIPAGIYHLSLLREIDLFHNRIEKIGPEFGNWQNLQTLYLSHNKIGALPQNIDTLHLLEGLYAWDNRLDELPPAIGNLSRLKYLRVNHNFLKEIPPSLLKMVNLEEIDFSHNYLKHIPEAVFQFPRLKILAIVNNPWDVQTLQLLQRKTEELRAKNVFVHLE